jgi:hypothetical protein
MYQDMVNKQVVGWHLMATMLKELISTALQHAFCLNHLRLVHADRDR